MDTETLHGRVALITGASRGLGKAVALSLAQTGASLALVGRDLEALAATAREARTLGSEVEVFPADVAQEPAVLGLERDILSRFGAVDILVNNAGINVRKTVEDFTLEEWNHVLSTNLTSAFLICRSFVPQMKGRGYGRILNVASTMAHVSLPARAAYSATKAGLLGFTRALALELAADGITVVAISPGPFATEMNAVLMNDPERNQQFLSKIPMGRWGDPREIGALAVFLCSAGASFVTGTDIVVDGGWCAQ